MSKENEKQAVRDLDFRTDFDANGELKNPELKAHFDAEREALLAPPVGSVGAVQGYVAEPPPVEKADADASVELQTGDTPDVLVRRYSKTQLKDFADANGVEVKTNDSALTIADKILTANPIVGETSLTVPPAASDARTDTVEKKG